MQKLYHDDHTACTDPWSCQDERHTSVPPACSAVLDADADGGPVRCDLPRDHPGGHLNIASGRER